LKSTATIMQQTKGERVDNSALSAIRETGMQKVEKDLTEINGIMHDLNTLAQKQSECIADISTVTNRTVENVGKGVEQLKKAEKKQKMRTCSIL
jgi:t-SNARE complex subunit (syntaxin)